MQSRAMAWVTAGVPVVHIKGRTGGNHLDIHAQGVHVLDTLFRRPFLHGIDVGLVAGGSQAMPGLTGGNGSLKALGFLVGMNINGAQGGASCWLQMTSVVESTGKGQGESTGGGSGTRSKLGRSDMDSVLRRAFGANRKVPLASAIVLRWEVLMSEL